MVDATSYYRGQHPLCDLVHRKNISLSYSTEVSWATMDLADVLFLQRPFTKDHTTMGKVCQKMGRKLWCDWDDDLFTVPTDNPSHGTYSDKDTQMSVAILAAMADVVTVSTPVLAKRFNSIREKAGMPECVVIPNALSDHFIQKRQPRLNEKKRRKLIFWRGSASHQADLDSVEAQIREFMLSDFGKTWTLHFMGYRPYRITNEIPPERCIVGGGMDVIDYNDYFMTLQPGITIVPLCDHEFNHSKSNICWLEATLSQSLVVAPDFEEWRRPGIFNYKEPKDFREALMAAMDCVENESYSRVDESWDFILKNLLLSQSNEKRWEILKSLCPNKPQEI